jgi:hypothetical protein
MKSVLIRHPHLVVRPVPDLGVPLVGGLHVGPDPAVEQQIHRSLQDPTDQVGRRHVGGRVRWDAEGGTRLG